MNRIFPRSTRGPGHGFWAVIVTALALSGCVSLEEVVEKRYQEESYGESYQSSVMIRERRDRITVTSVVRMPGENPEQIGIDDVAPLREETMSWGRLVLVAPEPILEEVSALFNNALDTRYIGLFEHTIAQRLRDMEVLKSKRLVLRVLLAPESHGFWFIDEQAISEDLVTLTIASHPPGQDNGEWWFDVTGLAAHELTHVNHGLISDQYRDKSGVNQEAAASIVGECAKLWFLEGGGKVDSTEIALQGQPLTSPFPGYEQGEFNPIMSRLDFIKDNSTKGRIVGTAALRTLTHNGTVDFNDSDQMSAIADYCKHVSNAVPDFVAGELR